MMEKSENYDRCRELLAKFQVSTTGETKRELGHKLADIVFNQSPDSLKDEFGLEPPLDGPGDELWVSPSDLLIPMVCLKPPLTNKYIKAITHEGILAIGEDISRRFWQQMEEEKRKRLEEQRALIMKIAEMERRVAIKLTREEEKEIAAANVEDLMREFERRLVLELKNLEEHILGMQDKIVREAVEECDHSWRVKMQEELTSVIEQMMEEKIEGIISEREELQSQFKMELENQTSEFNYALKREQEFCENTQRQLRHCLECKNLANLMYVLSLERRKCAIERCTLEYVYKMHISDLEEKLYQKDFIIKRLSQEKDKKEKQLNVREECLLEILKQFQKFINFALRAAPTQAEFLLSVEKMILCEIAKETWQQGKKVSKKLCKRIIPWKSDSIITEPTEKDDLKPHDYHECLNEILPKKAEGVESEILPYFYYNNKMYVRRDLKYYFDKGIEISESNILWNKDVEHLMQLLKVKSEEQADEGGSDASSGSDDKEEKLTEEQQEEELEDDDVRSLHSKQQLRDSKTSKHSENSRKSTVSFQHAVEKPDELIALKSVLKSADDDMPPPIIEASDSFTSPQPMCEMPIAQENIGLLAAQDSLATIRMSRKCSSKDMQRSSDMNMDRHLAEVQETFQHPEQDSKQTDLSEGGNVSFEHIQAIRILDEIELTRPSTRSSKTSLGIKTKLPLKSEKESILQKPTKVSKPSSHSKLLQATDSLIIHRNSLSYEKKMQEDIARIVTDRPQHRAPAHRSHGSLISKLSFTKDSLELIRKSSLHSKKDVNTDDVLVLTKGVSKQVASEDKFQKVQKIVSPLTISHIGIAKIPTDIKEADVRFSPIHEVYETNILKTSDSPWNIYRDTIQQDVITHSTTKGVVVPEDNQTSIVGAPDGKEHVQSSTRFTERRISSIMKILKQDPSLIRLFTSVTN